MINLRHNQKGSLLLEALLGSVLLLMISIPLIRMGLIAWENGGDIAHYQQATTLAQQGVEVTRFFAQIDFSLLVPGVYDIELTGGQWEFVPVDNGGGFFSREVTLTEIHENMMMVTSRVAWMKKQRERSVMFRAYLVNPETPVQWTINPTLASCLDLSGGQDALQARYDKGYIYTITDSASESFVVIDASDTNALQEVHRVNLQNNPRDMVIVGEYAYIASRHNQQELQIIDIQNPEQASLVGSYDASGPADMNTLVVHEGIAYMGRDASSTEELYIIDVSNSIQPVLLHSFELGASVTDVALYQNQLFVAVNDSRGVVIVDVSDVLNPQVVQEGDVGSQQVIEIVNGHVIMGDAQGVVRVSSHALEEQFSQSLGAPVMSLAVHYNNEVVFVGLSQSQDSFIPLRFQSLSPTGALDVGGAVLGLDGASQVGSIITAGSANDAEVCLITL